MSSGIGQLTIAQMTQEDAETVADWRYEPPHDFYDARADEEELERLLDDERRSGRTFSVHDEGGDLIGFFTFARADDDAVVIGLGLRPDLTGRGLGPAFVEEGLAYARARFDPARFRLSVAEFNRRAIKVYERAGFARTRSFVEETNGGVFQFVEMERPA